MRIIFFLVLSCLLVLGRVNYSFPMYTDLSKEQIREAVEFGARYPGYLWMCQEHVLAYQSELIREKYKNLWFFFCQSKNSWDAFYRVGSREWGPIRSYSFPYSYFKDFDMMVKKGLSLEGVIVTPFLRMAAGSASVAWQDDPENLTEKGMIDWLADPETHRGLEPDEEEVSRETIEKIMRWLVPDEAADELERAIAKGGETARSFYQDYLFILLHANAHREDFPEKIKALVRYGEDQIKPLHISFRETYRTNESIMDRLYYLIFPRGYQKDKLVSETGMLRLDVYCDGNLTHYLFFDLSKMR